MHICRSINIMSMLYGCYTAPVLREQFLMQPSLTLTNPSSRSHKLVSIFQSNRSFLVNLSAGGDSKRKQSMVNHRTSSSPLYRQNRSHPSISIPSRARIKVLHQRIHTSSCSNNNQHRSNNSHSLASPAQPSLYVSLEVWRGEEEADTEDPENSSCDEKTRVHCLLYISGR